MTGPDVWSTGRYEAVAERIAPIAARVVDAAAHRTQLRDAALVDLACGTGSAALAAAQRGARVTAVDITPELLALAERKAQAAGLSIDWVTADASASGLPDASFDAAVSNMGIIFVEPAAQVAELARLLKPGATLAFSAWVREDDNPFFTPMIETLGPPPPREYTPDQWGDRDLIHERLSSHFSDIAVETGLHTWLFPSVEAAVTFVAHESPMHVSVFDHLDSTLREPLLTAFRTAFETHLRDDGTVAYDAPYVVIAAQRR